MPRRKARDRRLSRIRRGDTVKGVPPQHPAARATAGSSQASLTGPETGGSLTKAEVLAGKRMTGKESCFTGRVGQPPREPRTGDAYGWCRGPGQHQSASQYGKGWRIQQSEPQARAMRRIRGARAAGNGGTRSRHSVLPRKGGTCCESHWVDQKSTQRQVTLAARKRNSSFG